MPISSTFLSLPLLPSFSSLILSSALSLIPSLPSLPSVPSLPSLPSPTSLSPSLIPSLFASPLSSPVPLHPLFRPVFPTSITRTYRSLTPHPSLTHTHYSLSDPAFPSLHLIFPFAHLLQSLSGNLLSSLAAHHPPPPPPPLLPPLSALSSYPSQLSLSFPSLPSPPFPLNPFPHSPSFPFRPPPAGLPSLLLTALPYSSL
ncbi:unnamed protein product [Closterium sp. Naga37s-1]|nr:unnamed protein product [Closterium sp. Naga37s-1]